MIPRIAITGFGSVNALGAGVPSFADGLRAGRCGIGDLDLFPIAGFRTSLAAQVRDLRKPAQIPVPVWRRGSRSVQLALVAAVEAWQSAELDVSNRAEAAVIVGTTTGGMASGEECYRRLVLNEPGHLRLSAWLETSVSTVADTLARVFQCGGPRSTVSTACSSAANALGLAADWIRAGRVETVLCGGTDSLCRMTYSGFNALQSLDSRPCRPFDKERAGLTLGEGAALFVFESWERARRRGARILGEFVSYGVSDDAYHLTQPKPDGAGAVLAMRRALEDGHLAPEEIDYINAHGTGTALNDVVETRAVKAVFGARAYRIPVSSTKSMVGHCLGAAGAIEALASLLAIRDGIAPPTANLEHADPECDLDYVPGTSRPASIRIALSNSYGFGGNNTSLILRPGEE